jgi:peptidoglycan/LPS O-acetylase OafA/YrhL
LEKHRDLALLDLLRWVSACLVAMGHLRGFLFADYPAIGPTNVAVQAFYAVTGLGHEAVMVFFVLSGYLVGGGLLRDGLGRRSLLNYFSHRFSRIYIVLLPALALTLCLDLLGAEILPSLYRAPAAITSLNFAVADRDSLSVLACNVANLQDAFCPPFGSNDPLWSLAYEWFYYVTFPVILAAITVRRAWKLGPLCLYAAGLLVAVYVFPTYMAYYAIWLFGVGARVLTSYYGPSRAWTYLAWTAITVLLGISRARIAPAFLMDLLLGLSLAVALIRARLDISSPTFGAIHSCLAGFSYSLYVTHFPLVVFLHAALIASGIVEGRLMPGWTAFALFIACGAAVYATAFTFSLGTEQQTKSLRVALSAWLNKRWSIGVAGNPRS